MGISKKPLRPSSTTVVLFTPEADPSQKLCQNNNDDNRFLAKLRPMSAGQAAVLTDYSVFLCVSPAGSKTSGWWCGSQGGF
jgi:hypothetical protein